MGNWCLTSGDKQRSQIQVSKCAVLLDISTLQDENIRLSRNVGNQLPSNMELLFRRLKTSATSTRKPKNSLLHCTSYPRRNNAHLPWLPSTHYLEKEIILCRLRYMCSESQELDVTVPYSRGCFWRAQREWWVTGHVKRTVVFPQHKPLPRSTANSTASKGSRHSFFILGRSRLRVSVFRFSALTRLSWFFLSSSMQSLRQGLNSLRVVSFQQGLCVPKVQVTNQ
jgi:hypothetical protein